MAKENTRNYVVKKSLSKSFRIGLLIMQAVGFFPTDVERVGKRVHMIHTIYSTIFLGSYLLFFCSQLVYVCLHWGDSVSTFSMTPLLITQIIYIFKLFVFRLEKSRIIVLLNRVDGNLFNQMHPVPRSLLYTLPTGNIVFAILPLINGTMLLLYPLLGFDNSFFPLKSWKPSIEISPVGHYFTQMCETIIVSMAAAAGTAMNTIICGLMAHARAQLVVLRENLQQIAKPKNLNALDLKENMIVNINEGKFENFTTSIKIYCKIMISVFYKSDNKENNLTELDTGEDFSEKPNYKEVVGDLKHCIEHHKAIVRFVQEIESVFTWMMFSIFAVSAVVICSSIFKLTMTTSKSMDFYFDIIFAAGMIFDMAIFCYFGDNIIEESSLLSEVLYSSNWLFMDVKFRKMMIIFMEATKKPIIIFAGKFFQLSMKTFVNILKTTYSYYAVLQVLMAKTKRNQN